MGGAPDPLLVCRDGTGFLVGLPGPDPGTVCVGDVVRPVPAEGDWWVMPWHKYLPSAGVLVGRRFADEAACRAATRRHLRPGFLDSKGGVKE